DWSYIGTDGSGSKQGIGNMDYCQVIYAGDNPNGAVIYSRSDNGFFTNSIIQYSDSRGFKAEYDTLDLSNSQFLNCDSYGVYTYTDAVLNL
ncbi:MAG: hypothetical protein KDC05_06025, partial [Bacteroidales bacterium]|nr:hypothetical protein [Bacteroidales bacterium]